MVFGIVFGLVKRLIWWLFMLLSSLFERVLRCFGLSLSEFQNEFVVRLSAILPDCLIYAAIRLLLRSRLHEYYRLSAQDRMTYKQNFIKELKGMPIAIVTQKPNEQHYEVPPEFFKLVLGARLKYSASLYNDDCESLDSAEDAMLNLYCDRSGIQNGMTVLDLGCGWGSFSLYACARYPKSQFVALSNASNQRKYIESEAKRNGFKNLTVITCDINTFKTSVKFDRIVSIEMFEHMKNYEKLLHKISTWLKPDGRLFVHIFTHTRYCYHFEGDNWMAKYFFSGGTMPSDDLLLYFQRDMTIVKHWRVNGSHYAKTCYDWLRNMDQRKQEILDLFSKKNAYGKNFKRWFVMWKLFYMAMGQFQDYGNGNEWIVSHYLFRPAATAVTRKSISPVELKTMKQLVQKETSSVQIRQRSQK